MTRTMLVLTVALAVTGVRVARATDVTLCGQKIARGDTGILRNDLVCGTTAEGLCAECDTPGCTVTRYCSPRKKSMSLVVKQCSDAWKSIPWRIK